MATVLSCYQIVFLASVWRCPHHLETMNSAGARRQVNTKDKHLIRVGSRKRVIGSFDELCVPARVLAAIWSRFWVIGSLPRYSIFDQSRA